MSDPKAHQGHTTWKGMNRDVERWRREHPWRNRWHVARFHLRQIIWNLTRIDIG